MLMTAGGVRTSRRLRGNFKKIKIQKTTNAAEVKTVFPLLVCRLKTVEFEAFYFQWKEFRDLERTCLQKWASNMFSFMVQPRLLVQLHRKSAT